MARPRGGQVGHWTTRTHEFRDPESAALAGGQWVRRGMTWVWRNVENPAHLRGFERQTWENESAPERCVNTTSGANRRINSSEPRSEG